MSLPRIGVFDSGVGGLTVLRAMTAQFPAHYFYFGDTARLPYGTKSAETVARYASGAAKFLEAQNIDLLVIACNSATALALPQIQQAVKVPVVGVVEPGAATASAISSSRSAVVIATEATVSSHAYREALSRHGMAAHEMACPLLVPLVEEGWIDHPVTEQVARIYLERSLCRGIRPSRCAGTRLHTLSVAGASLAANHPRARHHRRLCRINLASREDHARVAPGRGDRIATRSSYLPFLCHRLNRANSSVSQLVSSAAKSTTSSTSTSADKAFSSQTWWVEHRPISACCICHPVAYREACISFPPGAASFPILWAAWAPQ